MASSLPLRVVGHYERKGDEELPLLESEWRLPFAGVDDVRNNALSVLVQLEGDPHYYENSPHVAEDDQPCAV